MAFLQLPCSLHGLPRAAQRPRTGCASRLAASVSQRDASAAEEDHAAAAQRQRELQAVRGSLASACLELGVHLADTSEEEAHLWEDDYLDVVAEADDPWQREAAAEPAAVDALGAAPPAASSYSAEGGFASVTPHALAMLQLQESTRAVLLDLRPQAEGERSLPGAVRLSLDELSAAARSGELPINRRYVTVSDNAATAAQAAVRLRRVLGFPLVQALDGSIAELLDQLRQTT